MWLLYASLSSVFAAGVAIVGKLGLRNLDSTLATTVRSIIMTIFLVLVSLAMRKFDGFNFHSLSGRDWLLIAAAGIFGALSWLFYFFALKYGQATPVVAIDRLSMVFVFIMAMIFLGEAFSLKAAIGVILMVVGAIFISLR